MRMILSTCFAPFYVPPVRERDVLARPVLEGTGIGTAYERLDASFPLEDGITVYVYERTRDITPEEYQAISDALVSLYPDYAAQYQPPSAP